MLPPASPEFFSGFARWSTTLLGLLCVAVASVNAAETPAAKSFQKDIQPLINQYCSDCHADGEKKGNVDFDALKGDPDSPAHAELWAKVLKNVRAGIMPPEKKPRVATADKQRLESWIKYEAFGLDPRNPDPGKVTARRLNRVEYRNTVKDLLGVDFDTEKEFPPDDSGHGFDNIGDALTLPPMLLEKYLAAAKAVVQKAVPAVSAVPAEKVIQGASFKATGSTNSSEGNRGATGGLSLSYYKAASVSRVFKTTHAGRYQLLLNLTANERFVDNVFDYNKCRLIFKADGQELLRQEFTREGGRALHFEYERAWQPGEHTLTFEIEPLTPDAKQVRSLTMRIDDVTVRGPLETKHWVKPKNHERFFPKEAPKNMAARRQYAKELLGPFAFKAYRRPVDARTVDRLVELAESIYGKPGKTFEEGIGQAMVAVLASPRFLFREEALEPAGSGETYALVDEYALATRLAYFFWSSTPDDELLRLAGQKQLRKNLAAQTERLLADRRSDALTKNFTGQWLQTRDIDGISIDARQVLSREAMPDPDFERKRARFRELRDKPEASLTVDEKKEMDELRTQVFGRFNRPLRAELNGDLRRAMRHETEKTFEYVLREDRDLRELLDSDYTFLNERLAKHYNLTNLNVTGDEMRLVKLPAGSPRGGVLTHGSVLTVTSNPTRTSPVKRGLFVLENLLGTPPAPPPPDITPLEDAAKGIKGRVVSLRETLALHREQPLCSSCHNRMDPLGLALDNFNAMGMWRDKERGQDIDAAGKLLSGESFTNVVELKRILATRHAPEFYHTITEKLLTYALGRGLEYYDVETVDGIVARLEQANGRPSALIAGIVESAAFQKSRPSLESAKPAEPGARRADARTNP